MGKLNKIMVACAVTLLTACSASTSQTGSLDKITTSAASQSADATESSSAPTAALSSSVDAKGNYLNDLDTERVTKRLTECTNRLSVTDSGNNRNVINECFLSFKNEIPYIAVFCDLGPVTFKNTEMTDKQSHQFTSEMYLDGSQVASVTGFYVDDMDQLKIVKSSYTKRGASLASKELASSIMDGIK